MAIGTPQKKVSGLQNEAASVGEAATLYDDMAKYSEGLTFGKHFIKAHREYVKSNHKVHRLGDFYASLQGLMALLEYADVPPASSLNLLWLRACLWHHSREVGSTCDAMQITLDQGLEKYLADVGEAAADKVDLWVRVLVHDAFLAHWAASSDKRELLSTIEGDFARLNELTRSSPALGCLRPAGDDALALSVLLRVMGQEPPEVRALQDASSRLKESRMKAVSQAFSKGWGPEILTRVAERLQVSGRDEAANAKLRHAQERLQSDRVPRLMVTADSPVITSWESIHDLSAVSLLDEIVLDVGEALSSWSPIQLEAQAAQVRSLVSSLLEVVSVISDALVYDLTAIVASTSVFEFLEEYKDASSWDQPLAQAAFQELEVRMSLCMIDDTAFQQFLPRLKAWLEGLPASVQDAPSCQLQADVLAKAVANSAACNKVDGVLRSIAKLLDVERLDARDFVDEFTRQPDPALQAATRLPLAAQLRQDLDALEDVAFQVAELDAPVQMTVDFGEGSEVMNISWTQPQDLKAHLGCFVLREVIDDLIGEALGLILGRIAQSASLHKVRAPRSIPEGAPMAAQLGLFADATADVTRPAAAWLKQRSVSAPWAADSTATLARQMLQALRDKARVVGVSPLCLQDTVPERSSTMDIEALTAALDVFMVVGKVSCLFAWVRSTFFGTRRGQMVSDAALVHADLALAISGVMELLKTADGLIERDIDGVLRPVRDLDWRFPLAQFTEWKVLAKMLTDDLARMAVSACVTSMKDSALSLEEVLPPWDFLHDGSTFHMKQADRCLVKWHRKKELNEGGLRLQKSLESVADHWASWGFPGKIEDDRMFAEQLGTINGVYMRAQKALLLGGPWLMCCTTKRPARIATRMRGPSLPRMVIGSPPPILEVVARLK